MLICNTILVTAIMKVNLRFFNLFGVIWELCHGTKTQLSYSARMYVLEIDLVTYFPTTGVLKLLLINCFH